MGMTMTCSMRLNQQFEANMPRYVCRAEPRFGKKAPTAGSEERIEGFHCACARYRTAAKRLMIGALRAFSTRRARGRPKPFVQTYIGRKLQEPDAKRPRRQFAHV
jgi:hypothetical protein